MRQTLTTSHEDATPAWLEGAWEHARSHGQSKALAYLKGVTEDVAFEEEMAAREAPILG